MRLPPRLAGRQLACPEGIEPPTHSLEGCCSIRLSYGQLENNLSVRLRASQRQKSPQGGLWTRCCGRSTRIRTLDPLLPKQVRYQTAPHSDMEEIIALPPDRPSSQAPGSTPVPQPQSGHGPCSTNSQQIEMSRFARPCGAQTGSSSASPSDKGMASACGRPNAGRAQMGQAPRAMHDPAYA
jgi:hypothetical protein